MKLLRRCCAFLSIIGVYADAIGSNQLVNQRALDGDLIVDVGYGVYEGFYNNSAELNTWKGIRYAAPPTGDNRWRAPQTPTSNRTVVNATAFGPACPQSLPAIPNAPFIPGNEDCLFLNVYSPKKASKSTKLPVLVWIHGGGYGIGDGKQETSEIIKANDNGFVAVAIQYRLGAFGFLASASVEASGVVNAGILDMAFALKWVQKNIGLFGGDETKVTISGESAGGGAVMLLGIAKDGNLGTSLFRSGIAASPYLPPQYNFDAAIPTQRYQDFASQAGCTGSGIITCLRGKDSTTLQQANAAVTAAGTYGTWAFLPVTDLTFITSAPSKALRTKKVNGVNMLIGNNANEGALFVPPTIATEVDLKSWLKLEFPSFADIDIQQVLNTYPTNNTNSNQRLETNGVNAPTALDVSQVANGHQQRANNIYAEATFICPSYWLNNAYTGSNRSSYHYQYSVPFASHAGDLTALFGPAQPNQPPIFTSIFRKIWGEFIRYNKTTIAQAASAKWISGIGAQMTNLNTTAGTPYQVATQFGAVTQFKDPGVKNDIKLVNAWSWEGGRGKRCEFWRGIADKVPN